MAYQYIHICKKCNLQINTGANNSTPSASGCPKGGHHDWTTTKANA